jgi:hypothetical protein
MWHQVLQRTVMTVGVIISGADWNVDAATISHSGLMLASSSHVTSEVSCLWTCHIFVVVISSVECYYWRWSVLPLPNPASSSSSTCWQLVYDLGFMVVDTLFAERCEKSFDCMLLYPFHLSRLPKPFNNGIYNIPNSLLRIS